MKVAKHIDGRDVDYDEATTAFHLDGALTTADEIHGYQLGGQIEWYSPELQAWFESAFVRQGDVAVSSQRGDWLAVASLVCGLVGILCFALLVSRLLLAPQDPAQPDLGACCGLSLATFVASPAAIAFGFSALRSKRRRLAILGVTLGFIPPAAATAYYFVGVLVLAWVTRGQPL